MRSVVRRFPGLVSRLERTDWGSRFSVAGDVNQKTVGGLMASVIGDMAQAPPLAALCDYRGADVCVAARNFVAASRKAGAPATWPTALLVRPEHLSVWRDYAWLQGQSGNLKGVFTHAEEAERWAAEMAAIRAAQARHLRRA